MFVIFYFVQFIVILNTKMMKSSASRLNSERENLAASFKNETL